MLKILNCQLARTFRLDIIIKEEIIPDGSIRVTENIRNIPLPKPGAMYFAPDFGIIVWSKGTVLQIYSVSFYCNRTAVGYEQHTYQQCIDLDLLKSEVEKSGYFKKEDD